MDEEQLKKLRNAMDIVKNNANWGDCYEFKKDIDIILDYVDVLLEENNFLIRKNHKLDMELENAKEYADEVWRQNQDLEEEFNEHQIIIATINDFQYKRNKNIIKMDGKLFSIIGITEKED